ncbi:unnamed protein product [Chilo suppressalis]|uniref:Uncharacterized protein n=2 Tax=Chilo suppressalis TaxID=168631 RepID=A0ABN8BAU9_CHISP|nr:unnamed protein product [Chilo suppressalis]
MSLQLEESLLDFNIDFFNQVSTVKVPEKKDKYRTAICVAKKKIVATDSLIKKYYEKKEEVDQLEKALYTSKEECKKACIDFQNITDKCNKLDNEAHILRNGNQQLHVKCVEAENLVGAMQSHVHQLQTLVKENETVIEGLKIENQLEKANVKELDKKVSTFQKENYALLKDIQLMKDIILGKKKLNKRYKGILQKYDSKYESDDNDSMLGGGDSDDEIDTHCNLESPIATEETYKEEFNTLSMQASIKTYSTKVESVTPKHDNDLDSDFSNGHASADTGRGSSLAYSDSDKFFHSPDYIMEHSPINTDNTDKIKSNVVHVATSPIPFLKFIHTATSPITVEQPAESSIAYETNAITITDLIEETPEVQENDVDRNFGKFTSNSAITNITYETTPPAPLKQFCEKACLELNNSSNINKNDSRDGEIEMILSKMRFTHNLITPIPTTPSKANHSSSSSNFVSKETSQCVQNLNFVCKDALAVKEENISLRADIVKLANEIVTIKEMLNIKHLLTQQQPKICKTDNEIEFDLSDDDLIVIPSKLNHNDVSELESSQSLCMENINNAICEEESQLIDKCDIRKGIKRLEFEEPLLPIQNDLTESIEAIQETEYQEKSMCEMNNTNSSISKTFRHRKLTKLDRLRQKLLPKNKIKANPTPTRKLRKNKQKILSGMMDKAAAALKNKIAYEKAVKIISDLKSQEKARNIKKINCIGIGKQSIKEKDSSIVLKVPQMKISSENELTMPSAIKFDQVCTENNLKDDHNLKNQNSKRIIILEDILITNSPNYNDTVQSQQNALESSQTGLTSTFNGSKTNGTMPVKDEVFLNKVEDSLINTSQFQVMEQEQNILITPQDLGLRCSKESEQSEIENELGSFINQNEMLQISKETEKSDFSLGIKYEHSLDNRNNVTETNHQDLNRIRIDSEQTESSNSIIELQEPSPQKLVSTRSRTKVGDNSNLNCVKDCNIVVENLVRQSPSHKNEDDKSDSQKKSRKRQKRMSADKPDIECKRMLRSSTLRLSSSEEIAKVPPNITVDSSLSTGSKTELRQVQGNTVCYDDLEVFNDDIEPHKCVSNIDKSKQGIHPKDSILCVMIEKYGKQTIKNFSKKIPDSVSNTISSTLDSEISAIINSNKDTKVAMDRLVETVKKWDCKPFMAGLMQYLKNPQRKIELFSKTCTPPAPPMTKSEQILLYVVIQLKRIWPSIDIVDCLLCSIEYVLFKLNGTPDFDAIESMSHFYAIICRYFKMKSRLRIFMLDAMYCIQFKSVPLIKQCMEVWMHVLPLAHMGIAKSTLVTCMVYLLHFYKCEDKFNRVQDIRYLLTHKYFYEITEWNEPKIIEMFKSAITNIRAIPVEMKLLRISLIVIAKRHGPKWCQKNIIKSLLLPIIESDIHPERVKVFCVSILGPLIKPYPAEMRVHIEIVMNKLLDMLNLNSSLEMEEAIFMTLIYMSRHNYNRIVRTLLTWKPQRISTEFEEVIRDFVCEKTRKMWKNTLSKMSVT